jgi:hypothetical protein
MRTCLYVFPRPWKAQIMYRMQAQFQWMVLYVFLYIILDLQQNQVHNRKEHKILVWKQFAFSFYLYAISALKAQANTYKPVSI